MDTNQFEQIRRGSTENIGNGSRRNSNPEPVIGHRLSMTSTPSDLPPLTRSSRKLKSCPSPSTSSTSRFADIQVPPDCLARLHREHEKYKHLHKSKPDHDMSGPAVQKAWTSNGVWHVISDMPAKKEAPFHMRDCKAFGATSKVLLQSLGTGLVNMKGLKGFNDKTIGQDNCSVSHLTGDYNVVCVFDGHGTDGHWPSHRAAVTMPYLLQTSPGITQMMKVGEVKAALIVAFDQVQKDLVAQAPNNDVDLMCTGCTAAVIVQHPKSKKLWVATAGDSRVILIVPGKGVVAETLDHKPTVEAEKERLEKMGCEVILTDHEDGFIEQRVNLSGEDYPGLGMTRSLGDLVVKPFGVTHEPIVETWETDQYDGAMVLAASDGVWEFMSNDEVCDIVFKGIEEGQGLEDIANMIIEVAKFKWDDTEPGYCDDITVVLMPANAVCGTIPHEGEGCCAQGISKLGCVLQ